MGQAIRKNDHVKTLRRESQFRKYKIEKNKASIRLDILKRNLLIENILTKGL